MKDQIYGRFRPHAAEHLPLFRFADVAVYEGCRGGVPVDPVKDPRPLVADPPAAPPGQIPEELPVQDKLVGPGKRALPADILPVGAGRTDHRISQPEDQPLHRCPVRETPEPEREPEKLFHDLRCMGGLDCAVFHRGRCCREQGHVGPALRSGEKPRRVMFLVHIVLMGQRHIVPLRRVKGEIPVRADAGRPLEGVTCAIFGGCTAENLRPQWISRTKALLTALGATIAEGRFGC